MIRLLADEDFNNRVVRGITRRSSSIDIVRVHDVGLLGRHDQAVLEFAASQNRVLLTHDAATMIGFAYRRVEAGQPMPGVIVVSQYAPIGPVIDDLVFMALTGGTDEFDAKVIYVPMK